MFGDRRGFGSTGGTVLDHAVGDLIRLNQALENNELSPDEVAGELFKIYGDVRAKWQPVLETLPQTLPVVSRDLAAVIAGAVTVANVVMEDEWLRTEMKRFRRNQAQEKFEIYTALRQAGFGRIAALFLLLNQSRPSFPTLNYKSERKG